MAEAVKEGGVAWAITLTMVSQLASTWSCWAKTKLSTTSRGMGLAMIQEVAPRRMRGTRQKICDLLVTAIFARTLMVPPRLRIPGSFRKDTPSGALRQGGDPECKSTAV